MKKGVWIWQNDNARPDEYAVFFADFEWQGNSPVYADISVAGDYALYINGKLSYFGQYADFEDYKVYDKLDLTKYSRIGKNSVEIVAWYVGKSFSTVKRMPAGIAYEIYDDKVLAYSDNDTDCALSNTYISHKEKIITCQLGYSYTYDFTGEDRPYIKNKAVTVKGYSDSVIRPVKKLVSGETVKGVLIDKEKRLYDLGKEVAGILQIRFKTEKGKTVRIAYGEHIDDGEVRYIIGERNFTVELIGNGNYCEFTGTFRRLGCRYLQVLDDAEIDYIGITETLYPVTRKPYHIDNPLRKKIYETSLRTLELCMHEHYEDCAWREQSMYIMDSRNQMLCGYYAFDNPEFERSAILLMAKGQKGNGLFELCFPAEVPITIPSFSLAFPTVVAEYVKHTGDTEILSEVLSNVEKVVNYFDTRIDDSGLFKTLEEDGLWHFYEWKDYLSGDVEFTSEEYKMTDTYDVLINAYLSIAYSRCIEIYGITGDKEKIAEYTRKKELLNGAIVKAFYNPDKKIFKTNTRKELYSELANALCILADACPDDAKGHLADLMSKDFDGWIKITLSMNIFKFDAMLKVDAERYKDVILRQIDEIYSKMLDKGATSFWETELGSDDFDKAGSLCHGWSAIPVYYYKILGITK